MAETGGKEIARDGGSGHRAGSGRLGAVHIDRRWDGVTLDRIARRPRRHATAVADAGLSLDVDGLITVKGPAEQTWAPRPCFARPTPRTVSPCSAEWMENDLDKKHQRKSMRHRPQWASRKPSVTVARRP